MKIPKWEKLSAGILVMAAVSVFVFMGPFSHFKVTDPADPRFDVNTFRIQSYDRFGAPLWKVNKDILDALNKAFPKGTPRRYIESVFIDEAGYQFSDEYPANEAAFTGMKELPAEWNKDNYFVDYMATYGLIEDRRVVVRALYAGENEQLIEFKVAKYHYAIPPTIFPKQLHTR